MVEALINKHYPTGKPWVYKIDIKDEFYINEDEIDSQVTSLYLRNEVLSINEKEHSFVLVEFSNILFDTLPQKIASFLNKLLNINMYYVLELNKEGQVVEVHVDEDNNEEPLQEEVYRDGFYNSLQEDEKSIIDKAIQKSDALFLKNNIKQSLLLLFCYPGYFRGGLGGASVAETHQAVIKSNFLEDVEWNVFFSMNLHEEGTGKEAINLICTGDVFEGSKAEDAVLYQKIHNHFKVEESETYTDYTFMVMCDYKISPNNYYIQNATIDICETMNDETLEFNKNISIRLSDEITSSFTTDRSLDDFKKKFIKKKRIVNT